MNDANEPDPDQMPDPFNAALRKASGSIVDSRRLVAFLYLFLRDVTPCANLSQALQEMSLNTAPIAAPQEIQQESMDRANRLSDAPSAKLVELLYRLRPLLPHDAWQRLDSLLPLRDDVETSFSNGWLALYCAYVADGLDAR